MMDEFIAQAQNLIANTNEAGRKKVLDTLRNTMYSLELHEDTVSRVMFLVRSSGCIGRGNKPFDPYFHATQNLQLSIVRVAIDLQLFQHLKDSETPLTTAQLAGKTGADRVLLGESL